MGKSRIIYLLANFLSFFLTEGWSQIDTRQSEHTVRYTVQNGLAQNSVMDLLKGDDGFLWVATKDGLCRFDGYEFVNYKANSQLLQRSVSNLFLSLKKDGFGSIWMLNDVGQVFRFVPSKEEFELYPAVEQNRGTDYFQTDKWEQISDNEIWLMGAGESGTIRIKVDSTQNVSLYRFFNQKGRRNVNVRSVVKDRGGKRWILTDDGVWNVEKCDTVLQPYAMHGTPNKSVYAMLETANELIFACSRGEIHKYDKVHRRTHNIKIPTEKDLCEVFIENEKYYGVKDKGGTTYKISFLEDKIVEKSEGKTSFLNREKSFEVPDTMAVSWVVRPNEGLEKKVTFNEAFRHIIFEESKENVDLQGERRVNDINSMMEDNEQQLWVATKDGTLRIFDADNRLIGYLDKNGNVVATKVEFNEVSTIYQDHEDRIWIATGQSLYYLKKKAKRLYDIVECVANDKYYASISNQVMDIIEDTKGRIWLATLNGGLQMLQETESGFRYIHKENLLKDNYPPTVEQSHTLMEDQQGNIWLGSSEGLTLFSSDFDTPENIRFLFYNTENSTLTNSCICDIFQDHRNNIWLASYGGGLFRLDERLVLFQTPVFRSYSRQNNRFPSDLLLDVCEDGQNNLWVLSEESIVKFNPVDSVSESFGQFRGFRTDIFSGRKILRRYAGDLVASTNIGFYTFNPMSIVSVDYCPNIVFTKFLLFNKEPDFGSTDSPIHQTINSLDEIKLKHNQSVFSIEYAAIDYRFPEHIQYAYKLVPFETDWNYVGTQRMATYTNLPKGTYRFVVKSTNCEGIWYDNEREMKIVVNPSFWQTGWAYMIYILLLAFLVFSVVAFYVLRSRIKMDREVSESKLQFFTDISHELRTPLTLISAPLENVLQRGNVNTEDRKQLEVVRTNANRMLRMMNQILDFRKMQSNKMRLKVERGYLGAFVVSCSSNFIRLAESRHIQFEMKDMTGNATFWFDKDKVDTVMFNLLSNAFKFTGEGKKIVVEALVEDGNCVVKVIDEGIGIPKDKLMTIFERYTTLQDYSLTKQTGTGIGLSLVKEIIDLHKATIRVESEEGKGSSFILSFKPGVEHFDERAEVVTEQEMQEIETDTEPSNVSVKEKPSLLIVEDNEQMREFLKNVLRKRFEVYDAPNGKIGFETALRELPNFIITDIMMPEMDGIEMTRRLREEERVSHIPIVLLTAKTDLQSKIECLKIGANDYITKPFNMEYLEARIDNILIEQHKLQERYRNELVNGEKSFEKGRLSDNTEERMSEIQTKYDDDLMKRFVELIDENIGNVDFSPENVQNSLKITRWHLLSKVKSLVGMTPTEFIRERRLVKAAQMIDNGNQTMTEITYAIGMSDSRYFSRCFKQKYGVTPTEYKNREK